MLDLTRLEHPRQHAGKLICACPACREEGRDKAGDHLAVFESGGYRCAVDHSEGHRRRIFELAGDRSHPFTSTPPPIARRPVPSAPPSRPTQGKPRLPDLRPLTMTEMACVREHRGWPSFAGLQLLTDRGMLWHGRVWDDGAEHDAWIVTDSTRRNAQVRRLDGQPWQCGKAKTLPGSAATWPVGLEESRPFPNIMLCEGGPDFLAALLVASWTECADKVAPVAMLGAGLDIPADAFPYFAGKAVHIARHADTKHTAGQDAADKWRGRMEEAGAASVEIADFSRVLLPDGTPCKDLADFAATLRLPEPDDTDGVVSGGMDADGVGTEAAPQ